MIYYHNLMDKFHQIPLMYGTFNTLVLIFSNVTNLVPDFFKNNTGSPSVKLVDGKADVAPIFPFI